MCIVTAGTQLIMLLERKFSIIQPKLQGHPTDLDGQGGNDGLCVNDGRVAQVVQAILVKDLCTGLEPGGLLEVDSGIVGQQLGCQASQSSKHGLHKHHNVQEIPTH